jgi:acylphosphatase
MPRKLRVVLVRRRYLIGGRVQGVGFRYFARDRARREGVNGWVRNLVDGRVEAFAVGEAAAIARFEVHLRNGPAGAHVAHVDVQAVPDIEVEPIAGFEIRSDW